jgi:hypothetical protein
MNAVILCSHPPGQLQFTQVSQKVSVMHQQVARYSDPNTIAGCPGVPNSVPPCTQGQWMTWSMKVKAEGIFVLLFDSTAQAIPNGMPVTVKSTQQKVQAK